MSSQTWGRWRRVRQGVQALFFILFVVLFFLNAQGRTTRLPNDLFFRLDVLAGAAAMLSARAWVPRLGAGLVILALTLLMGRTWCGWMCPLGTVLEWLYPHSGRAQASLPSSRWKAVKYTVLLLTLAAAVWGSLALLALDPLALLTRSATAALLPAFDHIVTTLERGAYRIPPLQPLVDWVERVLRGSILPLAQPEGVQNVAIMLVFGTLLVLNWRWERVWCRLLCPLGAFLGLLSKVSFLRLTLGETCSRCGSCVDQCRLGAIEESDRCSIAASECTLCLDCVRACPEPGAGLRRRRQLDPVRDYEPSRRRVLAALALTAAGVATMRTSADSRLLHSSPIRPPGAQDEGSFLSRCLRCGQCMRACPTSGLQPALFEAGLEGLWTPRLVPRLGYCDFGCNACGHACPSQAIPGLTLQQKRQTVMGLASVDRNRCLPWAYGVPCIVCEEMCPVPKKAIELETTVLQGAQGGEVLLQRPVVRREMCIGCGTCEHYCPVVGGGAIHVYRS